MYKTFAPGLLGIEVSFEEAAVLAAENDFKGLQLNDRVLWEKGSKEVKQILERHSLKPGSLGLPVDIYASEKEYRQALQKLKVTARLAVSVGCERFSTYILPFSEKQPFVENLNFHVDRIGPVVEILEKENISLGLEFIGPKTLREGHEFPFIHTIEGILELISEVGSSAKGLLGVLLDSYHWYTAGSSTASLGKLGNEEIVDVHVNDAPTGIPRVQQQDDKRCLPGETGVIAIDDFMYHLREVGYDGPVMAEPFSDELAEMEPEKAAARVGQAMDEIWL